MQKIAQFFLMGLALTISEVTLADWIKEAATS